MDTSSIVPPPSGHARSTALMPQVKGDDAHLTNPSRRPVKPQTPVPDPLRRGNIALLAVLEGLPDATVGATRDGRIVFCNGLAEQQFGYDRKELIGQPIEILWPERVRERYKRNLELYFELDHPLRFTERAYGRCKDGSEFIGEMSWGIVESEDGPLLLAIGRNISERLQTEQRLRRQSEQQAVVAALGERALRGLAPASSARRPPSGCAPCSAWSAWRCSTGRARSPPGARWSAPRARSASRSTPATACTARSWPHRRRRARSARRRARSCRRSPTCWRSASRACTSRSRCASRRCTTR